MLVAQNVERDRCGDLCPVMIARAATIHRAWSVDGTSVRLVCSFAASRQVFGSATMSVISVGDLVSIDRPLRLDLICEGGEQA